MEASAADRARVVLEMCDREGFACAGITDATPSSRENELRDWLLDGRHGEMAWLAETVSLRADPTGLLPGANSIVMVAAFYAQRGTPVDQQSPERGRVARYARGRDYHAELKARLHRVCDAVRARFPGAQTRAFCDTAPVPEREMAERCGLGWVGKHTLLIHPVRGSWMVLGGFLTTLELQAPSAQPVEPDHCGSCTRCIDACPTDAITPYSVDARRCISYLTIEHESPIDAGLSGEFRDWIAGCDICQEVCPHNSPRRSGAGGPDLMDAAFRPGRSGFDLLEVLGWDEQTRRARFASSALKRVTMAQIKRNAILVAVGAVVDARDHGAANTSDDGPASVRFREALLRRLEAIAWDAREEDVVRESARDGLLRLRRAGCEEKA